MNFVGGLDLSPSLLHPVGECGKLVAPEWGSVFCPAPDDLAACLARCHSLPRALVVFSSH